MPPWPSLDDTHDTRRLVCFQPARIRRSHDHGDSGFSVVTYSFSRTPVQTPNFSSVVGFLITLSDDDAAELWLGKPRPCYFPPVRGLPLPPWGDDGGRVATGRVNVYGDAAMPMGADDEVGRIFAPPGGLHEFRRQLSIHGTRLVRRAGSDTYMMEEVDERPAHTFPEVIARVLPLCIGHSAQPLCEHLLVH